MLNLEILKKIGQGLRAYYGDVGSEPLPQRFKELLDRLDQSMGRGIGLEPTPSAGPGRA